MFDVGFWELLFLFTLALLVLGPDKLPAVVSTVGRWTGRARSLARGLRLQIEREMAADQTVQRPPADKASKPHPAAERQQAAAAERAEYEDRVGAAGKAEQSTAAAATAFGADDASTEKPDAAQATDTATPPQPPPASDEPVTDAAGPTEPDRRDER